MSSPTNSDAPMMEKAILPSTTTIPSDASLNRVSSTDSSMSSQFSDAPSRVENVLKAAADLSPEAVTSPLEALALACVAEKATEEQQQQQEATTNPPKKAEFTDSDVLCGRGGLTNNARGNIYFRHLVRQKQESYLLASKREKAGVAREIVNTIRSLNPPGRFLKKDSKTGVWVEIGERKAREKTSQALREGAPEKRQELQTPAPTPAVIPTNTQHPAPLPMYAPSPWVPSNRARVVSDDSVGMNASLMQEQASLSSGSKRKAMEASSSSPLRGPRLKLLKTRLMN